MILKQPSKTKSGPKRSLSDINSVIVHTTGNGVGLQRIAKKYSKDLPVIGQKYSERMANILPYKGNYIIDHVGVIRELIAPDYVAYHTGPGKKKQLSNRKNLPSWWKNEWTELQTPLELDVWEKGNPNHSSIGVDLIAYGDNMVETYTQAQYESLSDLYVHLVTSEGLSIPFDKSNILGHEDVDPISRDGWDPGAKFEWERLFGIIQYRLPKAIFG